MKQLFFVLLALVFCLGVFAQVDVSKSITLSGGTGNARLSGIKDVSGSEDALSVGAFQKSSFLYGGLSTGSGAAYTVTLTPGISGYVAGMLVYFKAHVNNGAGAQVEISGQGLKNILKNGSQALAADDIIANEVVCLIYDGTSFHLISRISSVPAGSNNYIQNQTSSNQNAGLRIGLNGIFSGNVGIGVTAPSEKLVLSGKAWLNKPAAKVDNQANVDLGGEVNFTNTTFGANANSYLRVTYPSTGVIRFGTDFDGNLVGSVYRDIQFGRSSTPYLTVRDGGNVGIGVTSPATRLDLGLALSDNKPLIHMHVGAATGVAYSGFAHHDFIMGGWQNVSNYSEYYISTGYQGDPNRKFHIGRASNSALDGTTSFLPSLTVNSGGHVGINNSSPDANLDVVGTVNMFGAWTSRSAGVNYQATTDGFIVACAYGGSYFRIVTDGNTSPSTNRIESEGNTANAGRPNAMCPVRKGDYWRVDHLGGGAAPTVWWVPLGQ